MSPRTPSHDVVVIGGGVVGTWTLLELARAGFRNALLVEKNAELGRGATGAWGSFVRVYHKNQHVSAHAVQAVQAHIDARTILGMGSAYVNSGSLYFLKGSSFEAVRARVDNLNRGALKLQLLQANEGQKLFPGFSWYDDEFAIYEDYAGYACPWSVTERLAERAGVHGASTRRGFEVSRIESLPGGGIELHSRGGERLSAGKAIVCAGAGTPRFLEMLGVPNFTENRVLQVSQFHLQGASSQLPFFIDGVHGSFGRAGPDNSYLGGHVLDSVSDPRELRMLSLRESTESKRRLSFRLPGVRPSGLKGGVRALENYTADGNGFLLSPERHPDVLVSGGWSCAGFTLAPIIADKIREFATATQAPNTPWTLRCAPREGASTSRLPEHSSQQDAAPDLPALDLPALGLPALGLPALGLPAQGLAFGNTPQQAPSLVGAP